MPWDAYTRANTPTRGIIDGTDETLPRDALHVHWDVASDGHNVRSTLGVLLDSPRLYERRALSRAYFALGGTQGLVQLYTSRSTLFARLDVTGGDWIEEYAWFVRCRHASREA